MKNIPLTQGKVAVVDDDDYDRLAAFKWLHKTGYAARWNRDRKTVWMHHEIIRPPAGMYIDHINGDGFDNRKANLRFCTVAQNQYNARRRSDNTTGFRGVGAAKGKYSARIRVAGKRVWLGVFDTPVDAAIAYDKAAIMHHGEFANVNFQKRTTSEGSQP